MEKSNPFLREPDVDEVGRDPRLNLSLRILRQMQDSLGHVISMLESNAGEATEELVRELSAGKQKLDVDVAELTGSRTVEGVFDGNNMVGDDGNVYNVPPNYASKSRLVEGDMMKLVIKPDGTFIFKQIGPMERRRVIGKLEEDPETTEYLCRAEDGTCWKLIRAAVTYFHGATGDEVVILVPKSSPSTWGAVENIVKH